MLLKQAPLDCYAFNQMVKNTQQAIVLLNGNRWRPEPHACIHMHEEELQDFRWVMCRTLTHLNADFILEKLAII